MLNVIERMKLSAMELREHHLIGYTRRGTPIYQQAGAAVTAFWYGNAFISVFNKLVDIDSDAIKAMLTTSSYTVDQDAHDFKNDITNEVVGTGYTATGTTLTTPASTYTGGTNVWAIDFDDALWSTSTITARLAVVYDSTPATDATRPLLTYVDFGADQSSSGGDFKIVWNAGGVAKVTVA